MNHRVKFSGGGTDGALRAGAGPGLTEETEEFMAKRRRRPLNVSEVVLTEAYNLEKRGVRGRHFNDFLDTFETKSILPTDLRY